MLGIEARNAPRGVSTLLPAPEAGLGLADLTYDRGAGPSGLGNTICVAKRASGWVAFVDQSAKPIKVGGVKQREMTPQVAPLATSRVSARSCETTKDRAFAG
jgi:hypothetical protein